MDIEGLGPETIDTLISEDLVRDIDDIYTFDPDKLLDMTGFGGKKVALLKKGIEKSKGQPFHTVFQSLGIPDIGQKVTELLIEAGYGDIDAILALAKKGDPAPLLEIHGIGERTVEVLFKELNRPEIRERIARLRAAGLHFHEEKRTAHRGVPQSFAGQSWCVTGSFVSFTPRARAMEEVEKRGGRVASSVSSKTTHLLVGADPGSKAEKARALGVKLVSEKEFLALLQDR
jgi:DNA ligase (NAD+)